MPTLSLCLHPPSCSMLFSFDLLCWHFVVGHGIYVENNCVWLNHTDRQIPGNPSNPCHGYGLGQGYKLPTHTRTHRHPSHQPTRVHKPVTFPNSLPPQVHCPVIQALMVILIWFPLILTPSLCVILSILHWGPLPISFSLFHSQSVCHVPLSAYQANDPFFSLQQVCLLFTYFHLLLIDSSRLWACGICHSNSPSCTLLIFHRLFVSPSIHLLWPLPPTLSFYTFSIYLTLPVLSDSRCIWYACSLTSYLPYYSSTRL